MNPPPIVSCKCFYYSFVSLFLSNRQETHYQPITVTVTTPGDPGTEYKCRTYQMMECIPDLTSPQYKNVVVSGAKEVGLPEDYMKFLNDFKHNGYDGHVEICDKL